MIFMTNLPAFADEAPPDLQGVWAKVAGEILYWNDKVNTFPHNYDVAELDIFAQSGGVFKALQRTVPAAEAHIGRHGGEPLSREGHPMLGTIGFDNRTVVLADLGDTTVYDCVLVSSDVLDCVVREAGDHALAGRVRLSRDPERD